METTNEIKAADVAAVFSVKRADLADALKALKFKPYKKGLSILNFAALDVLPGMSEAVNLSATNLETAVKYTVPAKVNPSIEAFAGGGRFCLDRAGIERAIKGAPKKAEITFLLSASGNAFVTWPELGDGGRFEVFTKPADDFPLLPDPGKEKPEEIRACVDYHDMQGIFDALGFSAATEMGRHFLNGIFFDGKEAAATDGQRLAVLPFPFTFTPKDKENGFIVPTEPIRRAAKASAAGTMVVYANMVCFVAPKITIISQLIQGNYPVYKQIIPKTWEMLATLDGAALLPVISSVPEIGKGRAAIAFLFTGAGYELYHKNEKIAAFPLIEGAREFKKKHFMISLNPAYMRDILAARPGNVQIRLNTEAQPVGLYNGNGAQYVIMPLRTMEAGGGLGARLDALEAAGKAKDAPEAVPAPQEAPKAQEEAPEQPEAAADVPAAPEAKQEEKPRCTKCKCVHEADSVAGTSFHGVELCPEHAAAPDLLAALVRLLHDGRGCPEAVEQAKTAISKARDHVLKALDTSKYPAI